MSPLGKDPLEALRTLAFSENPGLQQSAALYYLHMSQHSKLYHCIRKCSHNYKYFSTCKTPFDPLIKVGLGFFFSPFDAVFFAKAKWKCCHCHVLFWIFAMRHLSWDWHLCNCKLLEKDLAEPKAVQVNVYWISWEHHSQNRGGRKGTWWLLKGLFYVVFGRGQSHRGQIILEADAGSILLCFCCPVEDKTPGVICKSA